MLQRERPERARATFLWKFLCSGGARKLFWIRAGAGILAALFWVAQIQTLFKGGLAEERQREVAKGARRGRSNGYERGGC